VRPSPRTPSLRCRFVVIPQDERFHGRPRRGGHVNVATSLSVSSRCIRHQRGRGALRRRCARVHLIPVIAGYWQTADPLHSAVISAKHFAQQTAVIFGQRLTCFRTSSFNSPHSSQRSNTRTCSGRLCHFSSAFMSAVLVLICDVDGDDVRAHPPQFRGR
jgi:hypothetical protein